LPGGGGEQAETDPAIEPLGDLDATERFVDLVPSAQRTFVVETLRHVDVRSPESTLLNAHAAVGGAPGFSRARQRRRRHVDRKASASASAAAAADAAVEEEEDSDDVGGDGSHSDADAQSSFEHGSRGGGAALLGSDDRANEDDEDAPCAPTWRRGADSAQLDHILYRFPPSLVASLNYRRRPQRCRALREIRWPPAGASDHSLLVASF